ncbi:hypothetical protein BDV93DRAFT_503330 [Ceratobasidium sp. AG-I]|nr:hypothetical protein BDV93DRAFT_503330 [Ceratobasidium sp. AG-I]
MCNQYFMGGEAVFLQGGSAPRDNRRTEATIISVLSSTRAGEQALELEHAPSHAQYLEYAVARLRRQRYPCKDDIEYLLASLNLGISVEWDTIDISSAGQRALEEYHRKPRERVKTIESHKSELTGRTITESEITRSSAYIQRCLNAFAQDRGIGNMAPNHHSATYFAQQVEDYGPVPQIVETTIGVSVTPSSHLFDPPVPIVFEVSPSLSGRKLLGRARAGSILAQREGWGKTATRSAQDLAKGCWTSIPAIG